MAESGVAIDTGKLLGTLSGNRRETLILKFHVLPIAILAAAALVLTLVVTRRGDW